MSGSTLLLCHRIPFPPNKGDKTRSYALLRRLAESGPVHLACFIDDRQDLQYRAEVERLAGGECYFEPISPLSKSWRTAQAFLQGKAITASLCASESMTRWVSDLLNKTEIDNIVVFSSGMAPYVMAHPTLAERAILDMVDVDSDKWRQYARAAKPPMSWIYAREARLVEALERAACRAFATTFLVSPFEAATFKTIAPGCASKVKTLENGVDLDFFSPRPFPNPFGSEVIPIVMTGRMDYRPNSAGAIWYAREVLPVLRKTLPAAHFFVVGANPPASLRHLSGPHITVTGRVDDVRPYLQHARVVVAPLQIARGVQNKVLEGMAMGRPIVATREATRALDISPGVHLIVENEQNKFAAAIADICSNKRSDAMAAQGRLFVEQHHSWRAVLNGLDAELSCLRQINSPVGADRKPVARPHVGFTRVGGLDT